MLIVFIVLSLVAIVGGIVLLASDWDFFGSAALTLGLMGLIVSGIALGINCNALINGRYLDSQITMYTEENQAIEQKVADSVNAYLQHESGVMENLKTNPESSITIVAAYPELNSSVLITEQIKIYNNNSQKIKELKEEKVLLGARRWWVYFGS